MNRKSAVALASLALGLGGVAYGVRAHADTRELTQAQAEARRLSDAFVAVSEKASPFVVRIDVVAKGDAPAQAFPFPFGAQESPIQRGNGSGVVFTSDGAILTNNHVVEHAIDISVVFRDGRVLPARLVGRDPGTDLAVIKVDANGLTPARFADSNVARVGEWVVAIGAPFGLSYTVTTGVLSAKDRGGIGMNLIEDYLQTDASINPGNSGGPLCTLTGDVLGINTMIIGKASGIGFAVPSNLAQKVATQLLKNGYVQRAHLGVGIQDLTADLAAALQVQPPSGALVTNVGEGSPAALANLRAGDVIVEVGGRGVRDSHELMREVIAHDVGESVDVAYVRGGKRAATKATLTARPEPVVTVPNGGGAGGSGSMGLALRDLNPREAAQIGLAAKPIAIVTAVMPGSPADKAAVQPGDVIVEVDGQENPSSDVVARNAADGQLLLRVRRKSGTFYAALKAR
jgi:serine protease Do